MPQVEIYTQPGCPYCTRAKRLLQQKGVPFQEIDAPYGTPEREASRRRSGGRSSVPQIFVDGNHIGDCEEIVALDQRGELDRLLAPA